jgi:hypothetical protein
MITAVPLHRSILTAIVRSLVVEIPILGIEADVECASENTPRQVGASGLLAKLCSRSPQQRPVASRFDLGPSRTAIGDNDAIFDSSLAGNDAFGTKLRGAIE